MQLLGSGTILREVIAAAELLEKEFGVVSDIWSCPSFSELRRDGFDVERWNRLHPMAKDQRKSHVAKCLEDRAGPAIAATDYVREYADQIRAFMPDGKRYVVLGTDGFGRSDTRANLRAVLRSRSLLDRARGDRRARSGGQDESRGCRAGDQAVEARSRQAEPADGLSAGFPLSRLRERAG